MSEQTIHLLIVDDEESIRIPLADHLRTACHYDVDTAGDGREALKLIDDLHGHHDVALVDQVLEGGMNGLELLREIKAKYPEIQVIVFTGWGMKQEEGSEILNQGAYRYIAKPFNLEELALTIRFAAEQRQIRREHDYLSSLVQVSKDLTQTTDLENQLTLVWEYVKEQLAAPTFFIALYDSAADILQFHQSYDEGEPDPLSDRHLGSDPSGWGIAGYVVKTGQEQVWFNREQAMQEWQELGILPHITGRGLSETGICLPLQIGEKILGALSVQSYQPKEFDQAFLNAVRTLSGHIAPAIENARLFQEILQRTDEIETARDHLDRLVASSFDGIITVNTSGILTDLNTMAEQMLGYRAKEVIGKLVRDFYYDPEEPGKIGELLRKSAEGKLTDYEAEIKNRRGDRIPIRLSATWLFDSQGNRIGSVGYFQDLRHIQETEMQRQRLLEASNAVAEATTLGEGLQTLSKIMAESCIATFCSILLLTPDDKSLVVRAAYPFPRRQHLAWDPGLDKLCIPFQEPELTKIMIGEGSTILHGGKKWGKKVLKHLAGETKLPGPLRSVLIVPLRTKERQLGVCILGEMRAWKRDPITDRKVELARSLANQASTFIEKMGAHELTRQRAELLEALENLSLTISASLDLDEILAKTCQAAVELFEVNHSGLVLFDSNFIKGKVVAEYPAVVKTTGMDIPLQGVLLEEKLIENKEPIDVFDVEKEAKLDPVGEIMHRQFDIHSTVFVPVISKGHILGSFSLDAIGHKRQFTREEIDLCKIFAAHVASAIENARLHQKTEKSNELLKALDEASRHIRAEKEPAKLLQEIVRLAAELMGCTTSGLFIDHSHLEVLELVIAHGLPEEVLGYQIKHGEGLIGSVAQTGELKVIYDYSHWADHEAVFEPFAFNVVVGIPLKYVGDVVAVLFVADSTGLSQYDTDDLEILKRFAAQASIALRSSQMMGKEQRRFLQLAFLQRISEYTLAAKELDKIFHVILTGITAGYGLGFNRAALLIVDKGGKTLTGHMGIGHLDKEVAWADWKNSSQHGMDDLGRYIQKLEQDNLPRTPVDERIRGLQLVLDVNASDVFSQTVQEKHWNRIGQDEFESLPRGFIDVFEPDSPIVVVPVIVREEVLGLIVVDNKFTQASITLEDIEILVTFANTAGLAINNVRSYRETKIARDKIRASFEASNALVSSQPTNRLLEDIIREIQEAAGAFWVSVVLIDSLGLARNLFTTMSHNKVDIRKVIRPTGISMQVMRTGVVVKIENTLQHPMQVNPRMLRNKVAAALCLPFAVRGKRMGVVWIHYSEPRRFLDYEVEAIQLFVNQAAIAYDSARRMEELEHMRQAAEALSGVAGLQEVLEQIVRSTKDVLGSDSAAIRSFDSRHGEFIAERSVAVGIPKKLWARFQKEEPRKEGTAFTIMERGWVGVTDIADDHQYPYIGSRTRELLNDIKARSFQGVSLTVGDERLGVLYVNYKYQRDFGKEEQEVTRAFANHAALALQKASLLEQVSKARDTAKVVAQVTALGDHQATLQSVAQGTQETVGCDAVTLYVYDQITRKLEHPPIMVGVYEPGKASRSGKVSSNSIVYEMLNQDRPYIVPAIAKNALFRDRRFAQDENIESCVAIPLKTMDQKVGVMFVNFRSPHHFTMDELTNIELFATQAAIAIRNARLLADTRRRNVQLLTISEISKSISTILNLEKLMDHAVNVIRDRLNLYYVGLFLVGESGEYAMLRAGTGEAGQSMLKDRHKLKIDDSSMIGWSIANAKARVALDIDEESIRYINPQLPETKSEMALPLMNHDRCIGALTVQSDKRDAFTNEDIAVLQTMADQLTSAVENAWQYEELKQTKGLVGARTALAWMGMANSAWRHTIEGYAINIRNTATLMREDIKKGTNDLEEQRQLEKRLELIEGEVAKVLQKPITPPLSSEESTEIVMANDLIRERLSQLWEDDAYQGTSQDLQLAGTTNVKVKVSPEWFRRAFDILIDNAVEAMATSPVRKLTVTTRLSGGQIEIAISDTGKGIPSGLHEKIFKEPIEKPEGAKGFGMGLLMVQAIIQAYNGDSRLESSGPHGTTFVLSFPVVK